MGYLIHNAVHEPYTRVKNDHRRLFSSPQSVYKASINTSINTQKPNKFQEEQKNKTIPWLLRLPNYIITSSYSFWCSSSMPSNVRRQVDRGLSSSQALEFRPCTHSYFPMIVLSCMTAPILESPISHFQTGHVVLTQQIVLPIQSSMMLHQTPFVHLWCSAMSGVRLEH